MKKKKITNNPSEKELRKRFQRPKSQGIPQRYIDLLGLGMMLLLGIIIYSNSFDCSFHFDDGFNIVENEQI